MCVFSDTCVLSVQCALTRCSRGDCGQWFGVSGSMCVLNHNDREIEEEGGDVEGEGGNKKRWRGQVIGVDRGGEDDESSHREI